MLLIFAQVGWACQVRERRTYSSRACGETQGRSEERGEAMEEERKETMQGQVRPHRHQRERERARQADLVVGLLGTASHESPDLLLVACEGREEGRRMGISGDRWRRGLRRDEETDRRYPP